MAKLTAAQRGILSQKVTGMPPSNLKKMRPKSPMPMSLKPKSGYPGMGAGMNPAKMQPLSSMGRC